MEKKNTRGSTKEDLTQLLFQARAGEEQAILKILELYHPEMEKLAETIRMPKEDTIQSLRLELIEFIKIFPTQ
ncbi:MULTISPECIES: helix-turn-helix domain-containing protein [unclassified Paenibacillus]|uniref:helix-turn-helix domain-containing protein n=1 Tax=unclassified Paenibacillus TaxID=185978 RepID=UPI000B804311|nr:helix-turn-helix domain-containing protein [Paenibacillus sp. OK076]